MQSLPRYERYRRYDWNQGTPPPLPCARAAGRRLVVADKSFL